MLNSIWFSINPSSLVTEVRKTLSESCSIFCRVLSVKITFSIGVSVGFSIENKIEFSIDPSVKTNQKMILEWTYDLNSNNHRFQKNFTLIIEDRSSALYLAGGLIMLLAIFVFMYFSKKKSEKSAVNETLTDSQE